MHSVLKSSPQRSEPGEQPSRNFGARVPELDGIRGIAILTVLLYHFFSYTMLHGSWTGLARVLGRATENGSHGVDLFFVLSGFLITGILLDTRSDAHYFRNFYARRALRILPLYYTVLLIILLCYRHSGSYVLLSFFHLSNISPILGVTMVNGSMWSLSVEEHFYLCWPWIVRRLNLRNAALVAAVICLAEPIIRGIAFPHVTSVFPYTWFRLDGLASGALIACFVRSPGYSRQRANKAAIILACLGVLIEIAGTPWSIRQHQTQFGAVCEYPPINMICASVVLWGASNTLLTRTRLLRLRWLRICGDLSYCLYLGHMMVMDAYDGTLKLLGYPPAVASLGGVVVRGAAVLAVCFIVAAISRVAIEKPALRAKRFFGPAAGKLRKVAAAA
jgi:peptidoglycan/LPS O-acetylase OafA/YrhL